MDASHYKATVSQKHYIKWKRLEELTPYASIYIKSSNPGPETVTEKTHMSSGAPPFQLKLVGREVCQALSFPSKGMASSWAVAAFIPQPKWARRQGGRWEQKRVVMSLSPRSAFKKLEELRGQVVCSGRFPRWSQRGHGRGERTGFQKSVAPAWVPAGEPFVIVLMAFSPLHSGWSGCETKAPEPNELQPHECFQH